MSRILMDCNLSEEEQARIMGEFTGYLDQEEEEALSLKFTQYCFFETYGRRNFRECSCTRCGMFEVWKEEAPGFFKEHHGDQIQCPRCGEDVVLYSLGKMRTGSSLKEWKRAAFVRKAFDGGVLLIAGFATKDYSPYELRPTIEWNEKSRTYLAPGKRMQWTRELMNYWNCFYAGWDHPWIAKKTVAEPFNPGMYGSGIDGSYWLIGWGNIFDTTMKYCQLEEWYRTAGEGWLCEEASQVRQVYKYLARYTEYPLMEMAVKLGMYRAVEELVMDGRKNHKYLNWDANSIQGFLRMNKQDAKDFTRAGGDIRQLIHCRNTVKTGTVRSVQEYLSLVNQMGNMENLTRAAGCAEKAGVDLKRAVKYVQKQVKTWENQTVYPTGQVLTYWKDYLDAAAALEYDMTEETVVMPKNLPERHDAATQMVKLQASAEARKKYRKRYGALRKLYEFRLGDLCIVIPESGEEIVAEGKTLQHCVGGYADRHLEGKLDILFLRNVRKKNRSFLTIEMKARKSERDKVQLVQVHGYRNENYKNAKPASQKYKWFLDAWMEWLRNGSQRDKNGNPMIVVRKEQTA